MTSSFSFSAGKAGIIGSVLAGVFFVTVVIFGFFQPGYNHLSTSISTLVVGKYGWIQTVNFLVLALSFVFVGYGLGKQLTCKSVSGIFIAFVTVALSIVAIAFLPTDKLDPLQAFRFTMLSPIAKIHYVLVFLLLLLSPILVIKLILVFWNEPKWRALVSLTIGICAFNFFFGLLWFYFLRIGFLLEWKGLFQKILAANVILWLMVIGNRIRVIEQKEE